jgi:signal transduction histidine kinase
VGHWWTRDALLAGLVAAGVLVSTLVRGSSGGLTVAGAVLIVLTSGVLVLRRHFPLAVAIATLIGCSIYYPFVGDSGPLLAAFVIALYTLAAAGRMVTSVVLAVIAMAGIVVGEVFSPRRHVDDVAMFMLVGWLVAVIALGAVRNSRRALVLEAEKRAASEERLRIARELHDVLAHNISLINVQASAALHRKGNETEALEAIKGASKDALQELRATLGVLRLVDEAAPTQPPGLHQLGSLIERTRAAGINVRLDGELRPLPPEVDLAAYRIIQEALTNVTRHAGAREAYVRIHYGDEDVRVQVDDDGHGGKVTAGNGIRGMTERAEAVGGSLTVQSRTSGFSVAARLPIGAV